MGVTKLADYLGYFSSKRLVGYWAVGPETGEVSIGARSADFTGTPASLDRLCFYHALLTPCVLWKATYCFPFVTLMWLKQLLAHEMKTFNMTSSNQDFMW